MATAWLGRQLTALVLALTWVLCWIVSFLDCHWWAVMEASRTIGVVWFSVYMMPACRQTCFTSDPLTWVLVATAARIAYEPTARGTAWRDVDCGRSLRQSAVALAALVWLDLLCHVLAREVVVGCDNWHVLVALMNFWVFGASAWGWAKAHCSPVASGPECSSGPSVVDHAMVATTTFAVATLLGVPLPSAWRQLLCDPSVTWLPASLAGVVGSLCLRCLETAGAAYGLGVKYLMRFTGVVLVNCIAVCSQPDTDRLWRVARIRSVVLCVCACSTLLFAYLCHSCRIHLLCLSGVRLISRLLL